MYPPKDPRWKVAHKPPTVKLPFRMPRPQDITRHDLESKGIHGPFASGWYEATEPEGSPQKAMQDGVAAKRKYEQQDRFGNMAEVVAIIEWEDEGLWSAAVQMYHSDS